MAKDATTKSTTGNNSGNTSPSSNVDQQKVPPLRIVLNTSVIQKTSSTQATSNNQSSSESSSSRNKLWQNIKPNTDEQPTSNSTKTTDKVRIKLGTGPKQNTTRKQNTNNDSTAHDEGSKAKVNDGKDESNNYSHLRRITRRSQRSAQTVNNEDEESMTSITSTDENLITTNSDNSNTQDSAPAVTSQSNATSTSSSSTTTVTVTTAAQNVSTTSTTTTTTSTSSETPRRYKRRKVETTECSLVDHESYLANQNYKPPAHNSIELFKDIRKQVDRRIKDLSSIQLKTPHGFRDYMISRGAYLLDGNKLGNGTNLCMDGDGFLRAAPSLRIHSMRYNRVDYSVPDRSQVPLCLPLNSPLYNLFVEQEKERHKMRMQHIKEREKLTLASEQEIVRVHNQAAMAAANQEEPFSACTMLKHQEIYNYMDPDTLNLLEPSDKVEKEHSKPEGGRARRRQQENRGPSPPQASTEKNDKQTSESDNAIKNSPNEVISTKEELEKEADTDDKDTGSDKTMKPNTDATEEKIKDADKAKSSKSDELQKDIDEVDADAAMRIEGKKDETEQATKQKTKSKSEESEIKISEKDDKESLVSDVKEEPMDVCTESTNQEPAPKEDKTGAEREGEASVQVSEDDKDKAANNTSQAKDDTASDNEINKSANDTTIIEQSEEIKTDSPSDADKTDELNSNIKAQNRLAFLTKLKQVDDKWESIRNEMLIRHKNEVESLYAVQKLEWEWKIKEIGACDVRTTPYIDPTLVPKLNIFSQDY